MVTVQGSPRAARKRRRCYNNYARARENERTIQAASLPYLEGRHAVQDDGEVAGQRDEVGGL